MNNNQDNQTLEPVLPTNLNNNQVPPTTLQNPLNQMTHQENNISDEDDISQRLNTNNKFFTKTTGEENQSGDLNLEIQKEKEASFNETSINDLNVDGEYNNIQKSIYSNDPVVRANIDKKDKNTVEVTPELKTFIILAIILLVFIFIMPYIFDLIRNIKY